jgi:hypothetical protein
VLGQFGGSPSKYRQFVAMELMYRYSKISQEEIGKRFGGLDFSAVTRLVTPKIDDLTES